jgi:hypothetical protein
MLGAPSSYSTDPAHDYFWRKSSPSAALVELLSLSIEEFSLRSEFTSLLDDTKFLRDSTHFLEQLP